MNGPLPGDTEEAYRRLAEAAAGTAPETVAALVRTTQQQVQTPLTRLTGSMSVERPALETYRVALGVTPAPRPDEEGQLVVLQLAITVAEQDGAFGLRSLSRGAGSPQELVVTLPRELRIAFVLTQSLGLTYAQAATVCDVTAAEIRTRVAQAREHLLAHADPLRTHRGTGPGRTRPW
ncbi:hypothetical protein HX744_19430 [Pseudonocardia sp. ICBG1122]|nr:hypothetical protein [Pseudonocardia pini]